MRRNEPPAGDGPVEESEKSDEESDDGEDFMGVADDEIVEDEGEGSVTDKADLIDDIRAVLEEHTDEGALDKEDEETEAGEDEDEERG